MITLLAHHIELKHVPVLAIMFAAGFWIGWQLLAKVSGSGDKANG